MGQGSIVAWWEAQPHGSDLTMIFSKSKSQHSRSFIVIAGCYLLRRTLWVGTATLVRGDSVTMVIEVASIPCMGMKYIIFLDNEIKRPLYCSLTLMSQNAKWLPWEQNQILEERRL